MGGSLCRRILEGVEEGIKNNSKPAFSFSLIVLEPWTAPGPWGEHTWPWVTPAPACAALPLPSCFLSPGFVFEVVQTTPDQGHLLEFWSRA